MGIVAMRLSFWRRVSVSAELAASPALWPHAHTPSTAAATITLLFIARPPLGLNRLLPRADASASSTCARGRQGPPLGWRCTPACDALCQPEHGEWRASFGLVVGDDEDVALGDDR